MVIFDKNRAQRRYPHGDIAPITDPLPSPSIQKFYICAGNRMFTADKQIMPRISEILGYNRSFKPFTFSFRMIDLELALSANYSNLLELKKLAFGNFQGLRNWMICSSHGSQSQQETSTSKCIFCAIQKINRRPCPGSILEKDEEDQIGGDKIGKTQWWDIERREKLKEMRNTRKNEKIRVKYERNVRKAELNSRKAAKLANPIKKSFARPLMSR